MKMIGPMTNHTTPHHVVEEVSFNGMEKSDRGCIRVIILRGCVSGC